MERRIDPFPMRPYARGGFSISKHSIPWYLAEIVYARMVTMSGMALPPLEAIAQRSGGFDVNCMLDLLAGGTGHPDAPAFRRMVASGQRSAINEVQIVIPGTKQYYEAMREFESEAKEKERRKGRIVFGAGGTYGDGQAVPRNGASRWQEQAAALGWKPPQR